MASRRKRRGAGAALASLAAFCALMAIAVGYSVPAKADPFIDQAFLEILDERGIIYASPQAVIDAGYAVCDLYDQGDTFRAVLRKVLNNTELDEGRAGYFIGASTAKSSVSA